MFQSLLHDTSQIPDRLVSRGYLVFGELLYMAGDRSASHALRQGLTLAGGFGDEALCSDILSSLSAIEAFRGEGEQAMAYAAEALTVASKTGDRRLVAKAYASNGLAAVGIDGATAYEHYSRALDLYTELEQRWGMSDCLANLGLLDLCEGATSRGVTRLDEALRLSAVARYSSLECWVTVYSGFAALYQSEAVFAEAQFDSRSLWPAARGLPNAVVHGLAGKAVLLSEQGDPERGAQILGAAEALRKRASESWHPAEESIIARAQARLQRDLGDAASVACFAPWRDAVPCRLHCAGSRQHPELDGDERPKRVTFDLSGEASARRPASGAGGGSNRRFLGRPPARIPRIEDRCDDPLQPNRISEGI